VLSGLSTGFELPDLSLSPGFIPAGNGNLIKTGADCVDPEFAPIPPAYAFEFFNKARFFGADDIENRIIRPYAQFYFSH
jgi:hypothetical protein